MELIKRIVVDKTMITPVTCLEDIMGCKPI